VADRRSIFGRSPVKKFPTFAFNNLMRNFALDVVAQVHASSFGSLRSCRTMKKMTLTLFAIAALMLAGGRIVAHSVASNSSNTGSVLQAADDESTTPDPAGDPDGPGGPDGGPDGTDQEGGPGVA